MSANEPANKNIVVIGDKETVLIYRNIGCIGIEVSNPPELLNAVDIYSRKDDVGVILVVQDIAEPVKPEIEKIMDKTGKSISYIPSPHIRGEPIDMQKLLMKALGFG